MSQRRYRFLFCIPTTQLSGGVKIILEVADGMLEAGHDAHIFSWANAPEWFTPKTRLLDEKNLRDVDMTRFDFVVVSNAMLIPMVLPLLNKTRCVFLALDYESFHHSTEKTYESFLAESEVFRELYMLPVPIIATSRPIQRLVAERAGRSAYYMEVGINRGVFNRQRCRTETNPYRVLLVGNYLMPYKGMRDGMQALEILSRKLPMQLVLITQEERSRKIFDGWSWPIEIHFCPAERHVPGIMASCNVYCCTSWYEGLGLPAIEAFSCGLPVVSTRTVGVDDYALDGRNLLLANPNDPADLADKLRFALTDNDLRRKLIQGGFETVSTRYLWSKATRHFLDAIADIDNTYEGAGEIDEVEMQAYLDRLESSGAYTPIEVFREFQILDTRLRAVSDELGGKPPQPSHLGEITAVRDALKRYLTNERAQYYDAFKAKFDLCQLLLVLGGTPDERLIPRVLERRRTNHEARNALSFSEIRYPQQ